MDALAQHNGWRGRTGASALAGLHVSSDGLVLRYKGAKDAAHAAFSDAVTVRAEHGAAVAVDAGADDAAAAAVPTTSSPTLSSPSGVAEDGDGAAKAAGGREGKRAATPAPAPAAECGVCGASFSIFTRRHRCRRCERAVCAACLHDPARTRANPPPFTEIGYA